MKSRGRRKSRRVEILFFIAIAIFAACESSEEDGIQFSGETPTCTLIESPTESSTQLEGHVDGVKLEPVVTGLTVPWGIAFLPNGGWLVTERNGSIRKVTKNGDVFTLEDDPVAEVSVGEAGEGGLLGIAAHPNFDQNRTFYIYYTKPEGGNRVERYRLSEDESSAALDQIILDNIPSGTFHNGGRIKFGPDAKLYIGTGDARDPDSSQDPSTAAGKILRLNDDGSIPADNPVPGNPLFLSGIRNTQGFDSSSGGTWVVSDHGPSGELGRSGHDELNVAHAGDNLGWPDVWRCDEREGILTPNAVWKSALPPGGLAIYSGNAIPEWKGDILIGSLGSENLQRVRLRDGKMIENEALFMGDPPEGFGRIREVIQSPEGELYVTTSNCDGRGSCPAEKDQILRLTR